MVKMHGIGDDPFFQGQLIEEKNQTDNFNSLFARELKKYQKRVIKM